MSTLQVGILFGIATFVALFSGMPIAFALGGTALAFMYFFMPANNLENIAETLYSELNNFTLLTIPLFILMGAAIGKTHAAADLYEAAHRWLYKLPGSLGVANVFGCSVFAAMGGSSPATCAARWRSASVMRRDSASSSRARLTVSRRFFLAWSMQRLTKNLS